MHGSKNDYPFFTHFSRFSQQIKKKVRILCEFSFFLIHGTDICEIVFFLSLLIKSDGGIFLPRTNGFCRNEITFSR